MNGLPCCCGGDWRAYERPSEAEEGALGSSGVPEFHVPAAHALVAGERVPRATSGSEAEAEAAGARQLFGGGDRPISSRREPEEPKETVFLCTDTLLMLGARLLENRDFGKGVTTEHCPSECERCETHQGRSRKYKRDAARPRVE